MRGGSWPDLLPSPIFLWSSAGLTAVIPALCTSSFALSTDTRSLLLLVHLISPTHSLVAARRPSATQPTSHVLSASLITFIAPEAPILSESRLPLRDAVISSARTALRGLLYVHFSFVALSLSNAQASPSSPTLFLTTSSTAMPAPAASGDHLANSGTLSTSSTLYAEDPLKNSGAQSSFSQAGLDLHEKHQRSTPDSASLERQPSIVSDGDAVGLGLYHEGLKQGELEADEGERKAVLKKLDLILMPILCIVRPHSSFLRFPSLFKLTLTSGLFDGRLMACSTSTRRAFLPLPPRDPCWLTRHRLFFVALSTTETSSDFRRE